MLLGIKPKASRALPGTAGMFASGSIIGIFSSLVGIGGGTLSVPFLVFHNSAMHQAIGTAAAIGLPIALAGAAGEYPQWLVCKRSACRMHRLRVSDRAVRHCGRQCIYSTPGS